MMRLLLSTLLVAGVLGVVPVVSGQSFELSLQLQKAHIGEVFLGCQEGATGGYDRRIDIFAPPPGMQTGYAGFVSADSKLPLMYKDIRSLELPQEWKLYCQPEGNMAIVITWSAENLPEGLSLTMKQDERAVDMRKVKRMDVRKKTTLVIELRKSAPPAP